MLIAIAPLSRTPMDKKGGHALADYGKSLERALEQMLPWQPSSRKTGYLRRRGRVKSGEVKVILDRGESGDLDLFAGADIVRE